MSAIRTPTDKALALIDNRTVLLRIQRTARKGNTFGETLQDNV
jgi:hypothetical protein